VIALDASGHLTTDFTALEGVTAAALVGSPQGVIRFEASPRSHRIKEENRNLLMLGLLKDRATEASRFSARVTDSQQNLAICSI
jgi:hypothetical protein